MTQKCIGFIGAGNMPRSIIGGMVQQGFAPESIWASNPSRPKLDALQTEFGIQVTQDNIELAKQCDLIILSVKPQMMQKVCEHLIQHYPDVHQKTLASIAAGVRLERYHNFFGAQSRFIRIMPNTPSLTGTGMTGLLANNHANDDDKQLLERIFTAVGKTLWIDNETLFDGFTAVAGSGPAYFFEFMHGLQEAAMRLGFSAKDARTMVAQTALGAAHMAQGDIDFVELRKQVTSQGGSTAKGIEVYQAHQLDQTSTQAVDAAVQRNQEMGQLF